MTLPPSAPLQLYLRAAALSSGEEFVRALPGVGALIRLDERGGHDEPARWAYDALIRILPLANSDDDDDVFMDTAGTVGGETATGPAQPPLPIPAARDLATVNVLPPGGGRVGRSSSSAVRVTERSVSRQHALIAIDDDTISVFDLGSDNGTAINGMPLVVGSPQKLCSGDVLQLGDVSFLFLDSRALFSHLPALAGA